MASTGCTACGSGVGSGAGRWLLHCNKPPCPVLTRQGSEAPRLPAVGQERHRPDRGGPCQPPSSAGRLGYPRRAGHATVPAEAAEPASPWCLCTCKRHRGYPRWVRATSLQTRPAYAASPVPPLVAGVPTHRAYPMPHPATAYAERPFGPGPRRSRQADSDYHGRTNAIQGRLPSYD